MKKSVYIVIWLLLFAGFSYSAITKITKLDLPFTMIDSNIILSDNKIYFFDVSNGLIEYDLINKNYNVLFKRYEAFNTEFTDSLNQIRIKNF